LDLRILRVCVRETQEDRLRLLESAFGTKRLRGVERHRISSGLRVLCTHTSDGRALSRHLHDASAPRHA
jgi:hypothetical protein